MSLDPCIWPLQVGANVRELLCFLCAVRPYGNKCRKVSGLLDAFPETYGGSLWTQGVRDLYVEGHYLGSEELDGTHGLCMGEIAPLEGAHKVVGAGFDILVQIGTHGGR